MKPLIFMLAGLAAMPALPAQDPVAACREEHPADSAAYAGCLETALHALRRACRGEDAAAEPAVEKEAVPSGVGAEQVRQQDSERNEEAEVRILGTTYNARGLGTFRMAGGQVWRETTPSPERRRLEPDREYTARIVRSRLGGYRMYVDGIRHMKTVERIE